MWHTGKPYLLLEDLVTRREDSIAEQAGGFFSTVSMQCLTHTLLLQYKRWAESIILAYTRGQVIPAEFPHYEMSLMNDFELTLQSVALYKLTNLNLN